MARNYLIGVAAIVISGIMLKKTKMFAGDPAAFVMELPAYHLPTVSNILCSMWERGWSFIRKAGTILLLSSVIIWAGSVFGTLPDGGFGFSAELELSDSVLGMIGNAICWIFAPLGFGEATAAIATIEQIRRDFPILGEKINGYGLVWLDNGATTQRPQQVIDRLSYYFAHENSNVHRGAQSVVHIPVNAAALDADFFVFRDIKSMRLRE